MNKAIKLGLITIPLVSLPLVAVSCGSSTNQSIIIKGIKATPTSKANIEEVQKNYASADNTIKIELLSKLFTGINVTNLLQLEVITNVQNKVILKPKSGYEFENNITVIESIAVINILNITAKKDYTVDQFNNAWVAVASNMETPPGISPKQLVQVLNDNVTNLLKESDITNGILKIEIALTLPNSPIQITIMDKENYEFADGTSILIIEDAKIPLLTTK